LRQAVTDMPSVITNPNGSGQSIGLAEDCSGERHA